MRLALIAFLLITGPLLYLEGCEPEEMAEIVVELDKEQSRLPKINPWIMARGYSL